MKILTVTVAALCAAFAARASADTFIIPHVLETSGHITANNTSSPLSPPISTNTSVDVFGPDGDTGAYTYNYFSPIEWTGADVAGRTFTLDFNVFFCQSRPEGGDFRFEMLAGPTLVELAGNPVNVSAPILDISALGSDPQPLAGSGVVLDLPSMSFAATDAGGQAISLDLDAGQLRILPAPAAPALLALAGLCGLRRRRR